ncbi:MAG: M1 family aminopeptidase [Bacillota bacterium]|nr:M1 family aminopeptidase [Bacillota bacterium]
MFFNPSSKSKSSVYGNTPIISDNKNTFYNIEADIQVSGNIVDIKQDIYLKSPEKDIFVYIPSSNMAATTIESVSGDGDVKSSVQADTNMEITCEKPQSKISINYKIAMDSQRQILSYSENCILLTEFLITPAVYKDDKPVQTYKWPFGDPYIYDMNNYRITLKADKGYNVFAPGEKQEKVSGDFRTALFEAQNLRDFPLVLIRDANVKTEKFGDTNVYYINSYPARDYITAAMKFAQKNIGPYPYKEFFVVNAPISSNEGMEFSNMVFLSDNCFTNLQNLERVTYHEVFHEWFYGIIGTNQLDQPFLDEGLVNYLSILLAGDKLNTTYNNSFLKMHLNDYQSKEQYINIAYNDATIYFYDLHKKLGDSFYKSLKKLYNEKKNTIVYYKDFIKYFN